MFPSVKDGDLVLGFRLENKIQKDDLILYEMRRDKSVYQSRCKGTDYVDMDEDGYLYINGTVQSGEILYPTVPKTLLEYPYQVPKGYVFVLGDYRTKHLTAEILVLCRKSNQGQSHNYCPTQRLLAL